MGAMCGYWIVQRMVDGVLDLYGGPHVCRWVLCLDGGSCSGMEGSCFCAGGPTVVWRGVASV